MDTGTQLGPYKIREPLGKGGMGEVYRAHDDNLRRDVAIKLLPEELAADPKRLDRLKREARSLAALNHPHIATVHGFEEHDGTSFFVMELVEGETLAERLRRGALPVDETLELAVQIAKALEAAHQQGIVHRDLKPGNVKLTLSGEAKVLDFGLAKPIRRELADASGSELSTATVEATRTGTVVGTAPYMSPEQARGEEVDRQTDIWAFGCLLFEMLAGRRAFEGETVSDTIAAVLKERPDWEALPPNTPTLVQALLRRCLRRDLSRRLHDIADARIEIEEAMEEPDAVVAARTSPFHSIPGPTGSTASRWLSPVPLTLALIAAALMFFGTSLWLRPSATPPTGRTVFSVELEPGWRLTGGRHEERASYVLQRPTRTAIALSPDGRHLVYAATDGDESHLFLRPMEEEQAVRISGTAGGASPFFSQDGEWIGFFAEESLKKVPIAGGEARTILEDAALPFGAHWGDSDTIVLADGETGSILQVPAAGGESATLTRVATEQGETGHRLPQLLPGGRVLVFTVWKGGQAASNIGVKTIDADEHEILVEGGSDPRVLPTGHLLFVREGTLMAVPFDDEELKLVGEPVPVVEDVMHALYVGNNQMSTGAAQFSVSRSGSLAHATGGIHPETDYPLAWIDEDGNLERIPTPAGDHIWPRLSPDGRRIGYLKGSRGNRDVWIYDLRTGTPMRLTHGFDPIGLVWNPDGTRIVISSSVHAGHPNLYMVPLHGNGEPEQLTSTDERQTPSSWSTDGHLAFVQGTYPAYDIWILPASGTGFGRPEPFLTGPSTEEAFPAFSPDGDWLAYASDETGERQVYVIPYPGPGTPIQVSREGGRSPAWARDGGQIFYRHRGGSTISKIKMMAVDLEYGDHLTAGSPRLLFEAPFEGTQAARNYDVAPDGRFLVNLDLEHDPQPVTHVHVILNWIEELERQVPTAK